MQILQFTLGFFPAQSWGGPVKAVYRISKELISRGHQVTVYCTNLLNKKQKIESNTFEQEIDGIRVVYFNAWNIPFWPGTLGPVWLPDLPAYLKNEISNFDVVHINGYRSPMLIPIIQAAHQNNIPIVTQPHGTLPIIVNSFWVKRVYDLFFGRFEIRNTSVLIALQESEVQQALNHGVSRERIEIVPVGIDVREKDQLPDFGSFRCHFGVAKDQLVILFLGRINKKKGVDLLIEAFARLKDLDLHLVIAGPDDGQLSEVKELTRKHCLDENVTFTGLLSGSDVLSAFQDANLFVLPCRADTFPSTIIESCLIGIPMVVTDRCEIAHLIKNRVAEVVPFDPQAFADGIRLLLTDKDLYERYKSNCEAIIADTFSIEAVIDRLEIIYERLVAEK